LRFAPFRGSAVVAAGLLTKRQLLGPAWRRLYRDVYVAAGAPVDHLTRCQAAALLLPPGGALSHRSAAMLYGANVLAMGQPVEVCVPGGGLRAQPGLAVVRSPLAVADVWGRGGLPVTSPLRTAFDLARGPDLVAGVVGVDALLFRRVVKEPALAGYVDAHPNWNGVRTARRVLALARPHVESPMESRLRLGLVLGGLPEPEIQFEVLDPAGHFVARLDLAYRERRVGVEYDGDHHRDQVTFRRDVVRLNRLRLLGWTVLRFTADDVLRNPDRVVAYVRAALKR
jgi:very-short-patch-repair endonuclease